MKLNEAVQLKLIAPLSKSPAVLTAKGQLSLFNQCEILNRAGKHVMIYFTNTPVGFVQSLLGISNKASISLPGSNA